MLKRKQQYVTVHWTRTQSERAEIIKRHKDGRIVVSGRYFTITLWPEQEIGSEKFPSDGKMFVHWEYTT